MRVKEYLDYFICVVIAVGFFTLASFANTINNLNYNVAAKFLIYFFYALLLKKYYGKRMYLIGMLVSLILLLQLLWPFNDHAVRYTFPNYSFALFGVLMALFWNKINLILKLLAIAIVAGFAWVNSNIIYPSFAMKTCTKNKSELIGNEIKDYVNSTSLKNSTNSTMPFFNKGKVYLIEFYFNSCLPCRLKEPALKNIKTEFKDQDFQLFNIQNGGIDSLSKFIESCKINGFENRLYDSSGIFAHNLNIESFPYEIIIDKKGIIRYVFAGFGEGIDAQYNKETSKKINQLLNE
jgi:peroxiredoxin